MNETEPALIRRCPKCNTERPARELTCLYVDGSGPCHWDLSSEPLALSGTSVPSPPVQPQSVQRSCINGHPMEAGDQLCLVCGADAVHQSADGAANNDAPVQSSEARHGEQRLAIETIIDGWRLVRRIDQEVEGAPFQTFVVEKDGVHSSLAKRRKAPISTPPIVLKPSAVTTETVAVTAIRITFTARVGVAMRSVVGTIGLSGHRGRPIVGLAHEMATPGIERVVHHHAVLQHFVVVLVDVA